MHKRQQKFLIVLIFLGKFLDLYVIFRFLGHPDIGTAITKCFEHLDDEKHILDSGQLFP